MTNHYEMRYENNYIAKLRETDGLCSEIVFFNGEQIHNADFPASNLGSTKRSEYLNCMVSSVAREHRSKLLRSVNNTTYTAADGLFPALS